MGTEEKDYKKKIADILEKYEDGWDIFSKATDWDYPVRLKAEYEADQTAPRSWLELADKVISVIAHDKYELDTYRNVIELVNYDQMLDIYVTTGMPTSYHHWSHGKEKAILAKQYKQGEMGLAYEMVINSEPSISYCMENNSKTMQMLVIAHAAYGHNSFFKGNYLFKEFTKADEILSDVSLLKKRVREAEEKYGFEDVELLLDACHTLKWHGVDYYKKKEFKSQDDLRKEIQAEKEENAKHIDPDMLWVPGKTSAEFNKEVSKRKEIDPFVGEENIMRFVADYSPKLKDWERDMMHRLANKEQYFYPQAQTKLMNEGWASFWHYQIMTDLHEMKLINDGMFMEFFQSHTNVLAQPGSEGTEQKLTSLNPYKLGYEIFNDIKRMTTNPTEEDKDNFPDLAGKGNWVDNIKYAMKNFRDDSFVEQYLSPKVIRDFRLFALQDDGESEFVRVSAIHDDEGYSDIKGKLSKQYELYSMIPHIEVAHYDPLSENRELFLRHNVKDGVPLDKDEATDVVKYIRHLWGFPVTLLSVDENNKVTDMIRVPQATKKERRIPIAGLKF